MWHYRRPYGIVRKDNHVSGPFSNFSRRHCLKIESLAPPAARCGSEQLLPERMKARQRGQRIVFRGKSPPARRTESKTGGGESISSAGDSDENRRKSVCTLRFRGLKRLQCLRAVGLRPDSIVGRMQSYAPYAVPLKGKRPKKVQLPKEVHKVHTALCMRSQPYSRLVFCSSRKSAYGLHMAAYEVHTVCIM